MKYIPYKNIQIECGEPLYKRLHIYMMLLFIWQYFDWLLCIIRNVIGGIIFKVVTS